MIYVIDDDEVMRGCLVRACGGVDTLEFANAIDAAEATGDKELPKLIFLDILLDGPDGFTFLNELASYEDTARIPIVLVTSLDLSGRDFSNYGVVGILNKETMTPSEVRNYVSKYVK